MPINCDPVTFACGFCSWTSTCWGGARSDVPTLLHALGYNPSAALMKALVDEVWPCSHQIRCNLACALSGNCHTQGQGTVQV